MQLYNNNLILSTTVVSIYFNIEEKGGERREGAERGESRERESIEGGGERREVKGER